MARKIAAVIALLMVLAAAVVIGDVIFAAPAEAATVRCRWISGFWPWSGYWMCYPG